jgi:hypothetical protein
MTRNELHTVFGWRVHVGIDANPRSLANFPMQANGAEMLRLACCLATERGIRVCAPVHDALMIEAPEAEIEATVAGCQAAMREAAEMVLLGFPLRSDFKIVRHPERYLDPRGAAMWDTVCELLPEPWDGGFDAEPAVEPVPSVAHPTCARNGTPPVPPVVHPSPLISLYSP